MYKWVVYLNNKCSEEQPERLELWLEKTKQKTEIPESSLSKGSDKLEEEILSQTWLTLSGAQSHLRVRILRTDLESLYYHVNFYIYREFDILKMMSQ